MTRRPVVCAALVLLPFSLFGQDSTAKGYATPFHKGQWAAQFQAGTAFGSLGFIKFRSPTRAPRARSASRRLAFRNDGDRQ